MYIFFLFKEEFKCFCFWNPWSVSDHFNLNQGECVGTDLDFTWSQMWKRATAVWVVCRSAVMIDFLSREKPLSKAQTPFQKGWSRKMNSRSVVPGQLWAENEEQKELVPQQTEENSRGVQRSELIWLREAVVYAHPPSLSASPSSTSLEEVGLVPRCLLFNTNVCLFVASGIERKSHIV